MGYPEEISDGDADVVANGSSNGPPEPKGDPAPSGGTKDAIFSLWDRDWRWCGVVCMAAWIYGVNGPGNSAPSLLSNERMNESRPSECG